MLAHERAVFAFHQRIVVGSASTGLGEFNEKFVEQFRHALVHILRTVIFVPAADDEGGGVEQHLEGGEQKTSLIRSTEKYPVFVANVQRPL